MKLSLKWLNDYINHGLSPEKLAERLTMAGHEVKGIANVGGDQVFEIEVTPNRPDCLNVIGLAREISAIVNKPLKLPKVSALKIPASKCDVTIEDVVGCSRYVGAILENIKISKSPLTISERLDATGIRGINNVVDITNFCLFETGQPMHAFDLDKLAGQKIIVRRAKNGEKIVTIDGIERKLDPSILVIADEKRPVAIAGVMGGKDTEVTDKTKRILLESAYFDPILIRRAGRSLGLASDSSYRFERGVSFSQVGQAAQRAIALIKECAGGNLVAYTDKSGKKKEAKTTLSVSLSFLNQFLGSDFKMAQVKTILQKLEFSVSQKGKEVFSITAPAFRSDIKADVDIAEEVSRVIGYDRMPMSVPVIRPSKVLTDQSFVFKKKLRSILAGQGLSEIISYPMVSKAVLERTLQAGLPLVKIKNPLSLDQEFLRPSLLPGALTVTAFNFNRGQKDLKFFEVGKTYHSDGEREVLTLLLTGHLSYDWRLAKKKDADFFDLKGKVSALLEALGLLGVELSASRTKEFTSGQATDIIFNKKTIGHVGAVSSEILKNWDIRHQDVYFAEIDIASLSDIYDERVSLRRFEALPQFPSIARDVSLAVKKETSFAKVEELVRKNGSGYLTQINFLEQYLGEKITPGQKGIVFSLTYRSDERTLTDKEVVPVHDRILKALTSELGASIR